MLCLRLDANHSLAVRDAYTGLHFTHTQPREADSSGLDMGGPMALIPAATSGRHSQKRTRSLRSGGTFLCRARVALFLSVVHAVYRTVVGNLSALWFQHPREETFGCKKPSAVLPPPSSDGYSERSPPERSKALCRYPIPHNAQPLCEGCPPA